MKKIILIACLFSSFSVFAQNGGGQYYNPNEAPDAFDRGEVPGYMNNEIPPTWIDDPDYALLERHERVCPRCKTGRKCKYQDEVTQRLAVKYGYVDPYQSPQLPVVQGVGYFFNPQNFYNGVGGYIPPSGGGYCATGGYDTYGGYGGVRPTHNQSHRPRLRWQVGFNLGN